MQIKEVFHLQIEKVSADWKIICIIKEICADQRSVPSADRKSICRLKNYLHYQRNMCRLKVHLQIRLFADQRIICRLPDYQKIEDLSADQRIIFCRLKICRSKKYLICQLKNYLQTKVQSTDSSSICRQFFNLKIAPWSADTSSVYRLNAWSVCR